MIYIYILYVYICIYVYMCVCIYIYISQNDEKSQASRELSTCHMKRRIHACHIRRRIHACHMRRRIHACHMRNDEKFQASRKWSTSWCVSSQSIWSGGYMHVIWGGGYMQVESGAPPGAYPHNPGAIRWRFSSVYPAKEASCAECWPHSPCKTMLLSRKTNSKTMKQ